MPDPTIAHVVHNMPGRTRFRLPTLRDDMVRLQALALATAAMPGVHSAEIAGITASLLVRHDTPLPELLHVCQGLFVVSDQPSPGPAWSMVPLSPSVLPAAGALAAAGLAIVQLLRRDALPPALTLGLHAVSLARKALNAGEARDVGVPTEALDPD